VQAESTLPDRPEGRDSAKKRARIMADTSSSSAAMEMLQKMHDRGEKNDVKEDQLRHEMFKMERERLELQKLNWEKKWVAWEKKWAVMESNAMTRQNEYELNQWNADLMVMSQDLDKLTPALRAMYQQKQGEIMRRRGISTPPTSDS
jgi:Ni/Co efflux regulator RcnB